VDRYRKFGLIRASEKLAGIKNGERDNHLVATMGLEDLIVVRTPDAAWAVDERDEESVRKLVQMLKDRGWEDRTCCL
jgi:hypothetical protein